MFPYYCRRGMCPFFPMGYPQYPMPYMMNYGYPYPPFFEEIEEEHEHEHEHEFEHEHHRDEEDVKEGLEENIDEYRMAGPAAPPIPGQFGPGQFTNPEGILRYIELYQPDIIRSMVIRGIPAAEARRLVRRVIAITLRFCRLGRP